MKFFFGIGSTAAPTQRRTASLSASRDLPSPLGKAVMRMLGGGALSLAGLLGQTTVNLGTQGRNVDFTNAPYTRPVKTGTSLPATCFPGDLFFNLSAQLGQNLYGCPITNTWTLLGSSLGLADPGSNGIVVRNGPGITSVVSAPLGIIVGTTDPQTLINKSISASEINSGILSSLQMPALTGDVTSAAGTTQLALAPVNANPGNFGDSSHTLQITVDGKGRITAVAPVPISSGGPAISSGLLASLPAMCTAGTLYFATDQPNGQQLETCSSANAWTQLLSLGPSGAVAFNNGLLDIVTSVVPRLTAANTFIGVTSFSNGVQFTTQANSQPACGLSTRGLFWFLNNGSTKDGVQVCVFNGTNYAWIALY